jgi:hypothetical protein
MTPPEFLEDAANTFRERAKIYGNNWRTIGDMLAGLFPSGLSVKTADDWNRLHLLLLIAVKFTRYSNNFAAGGHADSVRDLTVYAAMLGAYDHGLTETEHVLNDKDLFRSNIP